jgi:predicted TIM-barrel fold metal-dependent hydrolase
MSADFLTDEQKRDILYDNAVRFLKLKEKTNAPADGKR